MSVEQIQNTKPTIESKEIDKQMPEGFKKLLGNVESTIGDNEKIANQGVPQIDEFFSDEEGKINKKKNQALTDFFQKQLNIG